MPVELLESVPFERHRDTFSALHAISVSFQRESRLESTKSIFGLTIHVGKLEKQFISQLSTNLVPCSRSCGVNVRPACALEVFPYSSIKFIILCIPNKMAYDYDQILCVKYKTESLK